MKLHIEKCQSKTKVGIQLSFVAINERDFINETTSEELDAIAKHHHAGHPYKSYMPFSTESVGIVLVNKLLEKRGINPLLIEWRGNRYGFGLIIRQKATNGERKND